MKVLAVGALAATMLGLVAASTAQGQTRIGAPLNLAANHPEGCEMVVLPPLRPVVGVPPNCTLFGLGGGGANWTSQVPRGHWVITRARVRTGPRVGPMAITIIRAMRSQAGTQGIICCSAPVESQPFTPQPNQVNQVNVQLPVQNAVVLIDGERVEVVDYLAISPLTLQSSVPVHIAAPGAPGSSSSLSVIAPAIRAGGESLLGPSFPQMTPLVNADLAPCPGTRAAGAQPRAGAAGESSAPAASALRAGCPLVFAVSGVSRNARRGIARMVVEAPRAGRVVLQGTKQVRPVRRRTSSRGTVQIPVRPRGEFARRLSQAGVPRAQQKPRVSARVGVRIIFNPNRGQRQRINQRVRLVRRR